MHPILGDRQRLRLHLVASGLAGAMLGLLLHVLMDVPWTEAALFGLPMGLGAAPVSLSAWYLCRAMPLERTSALRIGVTALGAAAISAAFWAGLGRLWWHVLDRNGFLLPKISTVALASLLVGLGALGYLLAVTVHYVQQASAESAAAERRALEAQVAHREAELRALRAQLDPHFLFNSLNSVVGLIGYDTERARLMCRQLAEFLRDSLTLGREARIPLAREVALAEQYLGVEQVRFGARLRVQTEVAAGAGAGRVPPLLLQPLVENAVRHGIATLVEGGDVRIDATRAGDKLFVVVSNAFDPDGPARRGTGLGLDIVRRRLAGTFGDRAALAVEVADGRYRVSVTLPAEEAAP